jgi:hypothetical protein
MVAKDLLFSCDVVQQHRRAGPEAQRAGRDMNYLRQEDRRLKKNITIRV